MQTDSWRSLLQLAYRKARKSKDPSTQNAALLVNNENHVLVVDTNRFPDGVTVTPERWERPLKYSIIEHAERNAIYSAAKEGISTNGLIMVCPWAACADCARAIIQSGIKTLVTHQQAHDRSPDFWRQEIDIAFQMFKEARIEIIMYDGVVGAENALHSGQIWNP